MGSRVESRGSCGGAAVLGGYAVLMLWYAACLPEHLLWACTPAQVAHDGARCLAECGAALRRALKRAGGALLSVSL